MDTQPTDGVLSLKWNNHHSTFFSALCNIRVKELYSDVTVACSGKFYSLHKIVLSTCSDYFEQMFVQTDCRHPIIVLKDIKHDDLEALLNYMYNGEVNVEQEKLSSLLKAAECLQIKGLTRHGAQVSDSDIEDVAQEWTSPKKRTLCLAGYSPAKKRKKSGSLQEVSPELSPENIESVIAEVKTVDKRGIAVYDNESKCSSTRNSNIVHCKKRFVDHNDQEWCLPEVIASLHEEPDVKSEPLEADGAVDDDDTTTNLKTSALHAELEFDESVQEVEEEAYIELDPAVLDEHHPIDEAAVHVPAGIISYHEDSGNKPKYEDKNDLVSKVISASTIRAHIILNEEVINSLFESDNSGKHVVYRCRICLYTTLRKNSIENHVVSHTDLQAFKCQSCPFKSNYKQELIDHCNSQHQLTNI